MKSIHLFSGDRVKAEAPSDVLYGQILGRCVDDPPVLGEVQPPADQASYTCLLLNSCLVPQKKHQTFQFPASESTLPHICLHHCPSPENLKSSRARKLLLLECYQELSHCSKCVMFLREDKGIKILFVLESSLGNSPERRKVWLGGGERAAVISGQYLHRPAHCPPTFTQLFFHSFIHADLFIQLFIH